MPAPAARDPGALVAGFTLAAVGAHDRGAEGALPGLSPTLARQLVSTAEALRHAPREARARALHALTPAPPRPQPSQPAERSRRALGLVADACSDRHAARQWLGAGGIPRPGFSLPPQLRSLLLRLSSTGAGGTTD